MTFICGIAIDLRGGRCRVVRRQFGEALILDKGGLWGNRNRRGATGKEGQRNGKNSV